MISNIPIYPLTITVIPTYSLSIVESSKTLRTVVAETPIAISIPAQPSNIIIGLALSPNGSGEDWISDPTDQM